MKIYALCKVVETGDPLNGEPDVTLRYHSAHKTLTSACGAARVMFASLRDADIEWCRTNRPEEGFCMDDYAVHEEAINGSQVVVTLRRRSGFEFIKLGQYVIDVSNAFDISPEEVVKHGF